jgi:hypothetical protein
MTRDGQSRHTAFNLVFHELCARAYGEEEKNCGISRRIGGSCPISEIQKNRAAREGEGVPDTVCEIAEVVCRTQ